MAVLLLFILLYHVQYFKVHLQLLTWLHLSHVANQGESKVLIFIWWLVVREEFRHFPKLLLKTVIHFPPLVLPVLR